MANRPNILFIHTDEQRADTLGCYGNDLVETDRIDGLAADGVTFEEAHCTHPLCMPSRGSLLTGRYPSANGLWRNGIALPEDEQTIAEELRDVGYSTGLLGKAHFTPYGGDPGRYPESNRIGNVDEETCWEFWRSFEGPYYGFDHVEMSLAHGRGSLDGGHYGLWVHEEHPEAVELFEQENALEPTNTEFNSWVSAALLDVHASTWVADRTIDFMETHVDGDDPFFAWVGIPDPHFPYDPPRPYAGQTDPGDVALPTDWRAEAWDDVPQIVEQYMGEQYGAPWGEITEEQARETIAHYYDMVNLVDDSVGRILDGLDRFGIADDTVVVFTSDHGDWLGDHAMWQKGAVHTRGVTRIPWIIRWPGVTAPGRRVAPVSSQIDMVPTLLDAAGVDIPYGVQGTSLRPVLTGESSSVRPFAYVEHRHEEGGSVNFSPGDVHLKTVITDRYRYSHYTGIEEAYGELFDHEGDSEETKNLWRVDSDLRCELQSVLVEAMIHAEDPLPERTSGAGA